MIIKVFGVVIMAAGTPYTMDECVESLKVLELPTELGATAECTTTYMPQGRLSDKQLIALEAWTAEQERRDN